MALDLVSHLARQIAFSRATFGPGRNTERIVAHACKELDEILDADGSPEEWVDLVILALDGLTRSILFAEGGAGATDDAAAEAALLLREKQAINERRDWPDWRRADPDKPIEHERGADGIRAGLFRAADMCVLTGQDLAEGDWGPEGRDMAVMLEQRIRDAGEGRGQ